jgi:hypothetical protein
MVWGKRSVTGTITIDTSKSLLNFRDIDTGKIDLKNYGKIATSSSSSYLSTEVLAQFADLGYSVDGTDTRSMVIEFQKDHDIIKTSTDESA